MFCIFLQLLHLCKFICLYFESLKMLSFISLFFFYIYLYLFFRTRLLNCSLSIRLLLSPLFCVYSAKNCLNHYMKILMQT